MNKSLSQLEIKKILFKLLYKIIGDIRKGKREKLEVKDVYELYKLVPKVKIKEWKPYVLRFFEELGSSKTEKEIDLIRLTKELGEFGDEFKIILYETLDEKYPDIYEILENKKISTPKVEEVLFRLLWKILREVEDERRSVWDIGDVGGIYFSFLNHRKKWHSHIALFLEGLTEFKVQHGDRWNGDPKNVEKDLIELAEKFNMPLL